MDKSMMWIVLALVVAYVFLSDDVQGGVTGAGRFNIGNHYPIPGPSPSGTSYGQAGPYAAYPKSSTNGYDVGVASVNALGTIIPALVSLGGSSDSYDTSYVDSLPLE
jgi:hypothetical protein